MIYVYIVFWLFIKYKEWLNSVREKKLYEYLGGLEEDLWREIIWVGW